ncbi:MAG: hypothetical protein ACTHK3_06750 [Solirubrobacterales bacterium]
MTRPPVLVPALAIAALLLPASVAAAPAVDAVSRSPSVDIEFALAANNGLYAQVANYEQVTLEIKRKGRFATYEVPGEVTETGMKAQFGALGRIDVTFEPTETRTEEPPKGCTGKPTTMSDGFFVGTIEFTGERQYVRIAQTRAKGTLSVWRESEWQCPGRKGPRHPHVVAARPSVAGPPGRSKVEKEPASLVALSRRCHCVFAAFAERDRKGRGPSAFVGAEFEKREGMEITRATTANAGASAFVFDHKTGTASVRPPQPFTGHATFKRRPHKRDLWRSTIRVPLLGAAPLSARGPDFRARLVRALPGGE